MKKPCYPAAAVCLTLIAFASSGFGQSEKKISPIPTTKAPVAPAAVPNAAPAPATTTAAKPAPKAAEATKYIVKSGDNPWLIAKNHGVSLEALLKANTIKDAKNMKIGDEIVIPAGGTTAAPKAAIANVAKPSSPAAVATSASDSWELYTIKSGDNPWKISKNLKVDHQKIMSLNEGVDFQKLQIGQQIKVPKKS
jgi:peptidoglycan endopeptidase LytF